MHISVITIFPELFTEFLSTSLIGRAVGTGDLDVSVHNLRDFADGKHQTVDDEPYGGGGGMVMKAPPWIEAVRVVANDAPSRCILLSPQGRRLTDSGVRELAGAKERLILLCGRYEGIDERVRVAVVDDEISIGDFVLSGGELPAMVLIEALSRQVPGVVGQPQCVEQDSFRNGLLDYPHYTRPQVVEGVPVPDILVSGDHGAIRAWRGRQAIRATWEKRPDLLAQAALTEEQLEWLAEIEREGSGYPPDAVDLVTQPEDKDNTKSPRE
ncbi:MAG: tRNA (guanosine(37)-N1)-methyltransferase TrmD [Thermoanaerobaculia bacterium]